MPWRAQRHPTSSNGPSSQEGLIAATTDRHYLTADGLETNSNISGVKIPEFSFEQVATVWRFEAGGGSWAVEQKANALQRGPAWLDGVVISIWERSLLPFFAFAMHGGPIRQVRVAEVHDLGQDSTEAVPVCVGIWEMNSALVRRWYLEGGGFTIILSFEEITMTTIAYQNEGSGLAAKAIGRKKFGYDAGKGQATRQ
jgi:hypothetical protein